MATGGLRWFSVFMIQEGTPGTAESISAPHEPLLVDLNSIKLGLGGPNGGASVARDVVRERDDRLANVATKARYRTLSFSMEVAPGNAADNPPLCADILQAAGFDETVNVATSVVYTRLAGWNHAPVSYTVFLETQASASVPGNRFQLTGAIVTSLKMRRARGGKLMLDVTMAGQYVRRTQITATTALTEDSTAPFAQASDEASNFSIHNYDAIVWDWSIDWQMKVIERPHSASPSTHGFVFPFKVEFGAPSLQLEAEEVGETVHGIEEDLEDATAADLQAILASGSRKLTIALVDCQLVKSDVKPGRLLMRSLTYEAHDDGTNYSSTLTFT